ncbi:MAG: alpha-galactosidase [Clostridia bacterium]|nr:alpha-galactosidase [Clostridia bacterium]
MNVKEISFDIKYKANGKKYNCQSAQCEHFSLNYSIEDGVLKMSVIPTAKVEFLNFDVKLPYKYKSENRIFVNGYQSWTDSMEYAPDEKMSELTRITRALFTSPLGNRIGLSKSGDNLFWTYPRKRGIFYGWSYGYVRNGNSVEIFGSLSERSGYTVFTFDCYADLVIISKELQGVVYDSEKTLMEVAFVEGEYDEAFDEYFRKMNVTSRESKKRVGYTSWYNYYSHINEEVINRDLSSIADQEIKFDCFQIDDGYQQAIGDWLITDKNKFPHGMKAVADSIHKNGMLAGLWLAPFAGTKRSQLFREHRDWFIKDKHGKPYNTGHNWGGFYSLDIYNPDVRSYLKHVFDVVLNEWGYDLVKLDFLYGACVLPIHGKSRGEIMCDAMDLIRECCGDKLVLGCGVPLMPAFGKVDYCRIGSDIHLKWNNRKYTMREDVSTPHAVCNSIFRRHLDGRAWKNDPDVFLLRDNNIGMTFKQRKMLAKVNSTFGSLLFISDDVSLYKEEQKIALKETFEPKQVKILSAGFERKDVMKADYIQNGERKTMRFNVRTGEELD